MAVVANRARVFMNIYASNVRLYFFFFFFSLLSGCNVITVINFNRGAGQ